MTLYVRDGHFCGGGDQLKISSPGIALTSRILVGGGKGAIKVNSLNKLNTYNIIFMNVLVVINSVDVSILVLIDPSSM